MGRDAWVLVSSAVLGLVMAMVAFEVLHLGFAFWILIVATVFGLCAGIGFGVTGRWHPLVGALCTGTLFLLLFGPYGCSESISAQGRFDRWECVTALNLSLPGFAGRDSSPAMTIPLLIGLAAAVVYWFLAMRIRRRRLASSAIDRSP